MMKIFFANNKLAAELTNDRAMVRAYGAQCAKKMSLRLQALKAANSLDDFEPGTPPERCHELQGDMAGTFSIDVKQPYRLLFKPLVFASPRPADRREFWKSITEIEITEVRDTHG